MAQTRTTRLSEGQAKLNRLFVEGRLRPFIDRVNELAGSDLTYQYAYQVAIGKRQPSLRFMSVLNHLSLEGQGRIRLFEWSDSFLPIESELQSQLLRLCRRGNFLQALDSAGLTQAEKSQTLSFISGVDDALSLDLAQKLGDLSNQLKS